MSQGKDRLKQIRKALGLSQSEFADSICIPLSTINSIEGGKQKLSVRVALAMKNKIVMRPDGKLCITTFNNPAHFDDAQLNIDWLVAGIGEPFDKTINGDILYIKCNEEEITLPVGKNITFFQVNDDSMEPRFSINEYAAIDTKQKDVTNGDVFLIDYNSIRMLRKLYIVNKDKYNIVALNEKVMPSIEAEKGEISIIGKWIYKIRISDRLKLY